MACAVLVSCIQGAEMDFDNESDLETRALREFYPKDPNLTNEKQLVSITHFSAHRKQIMFPSLKKILMILALNDLNMFTARGFT